VVWFMRKLLYTRMFGCFVIEHVKDIKADKSSCSTIVRIL